jgi:hypothetical protein
MAAAQASLLEMLSRNRHGEAVGNIMGTYGDVFETGLMACERAWIMEGSRRRAALWPRLVHWATALPQFLQPKEDAGEDLPEPLWHGLEFVDGSKCVAIREGLRRYLGKAQGDTSVTPWRAVPADWRVLFDAPPAGVAPVGATTVPGASATAGRAQTAVRGVRGRGAANGAMVEAPLMEIPGEIDEAKGQFCRLIDRKGLERLLHDRDSVLLTFFVTEDDVVVLPLRRDTSGQVQLLHTPEGYFRATGVLPQLRDVVHDQNAFTEAIAADYSGMPAPDLVRELGPMSEVYERLYRLLRLDALLALIEPDAGRRSGLHLILIPDGPLHGLPLHAACDPAGGRRLYQQVASVRYGLSLRTLELQQDIQDARAAAEADDRTLRGVGFACSDQTMKVLDGVTFHDPDAHPLPGVIDEVRALIEETGAGSWWLHGDRPPPDQQAIRGNFRRHHRAGNLGWFMAHGEEEVEDEFEGPDGRMIRVKEPGTYLVDGLVSIARLLAHGYDFSAWRVVNFSCCLLGRLSALGKSRELMGYNAALTLLGCRRVASALWWLSDDAAPVFARFWIRAIRTHVFGPNPPGPHAFALAFKEALDGFRSFDGGRFDHEFYWAPYTLYGLG